MNCVTGEQANIDHVDLKTYTLPDPLQLVYQDAYNDWLAKDWSTWRALFGHFSLWSIHIQLEKLK